MVYNNIMNHILTNTSGSVTLNEDQFQTLVEAVKANTVYSSPGFKVEFYDGGAYLTVGSNELDLPNSDLEKLY